MIDDLLVRGEKARIKVKQELSALNSYQLNWKPDPESWSVGQCLDHLIIGDCLFFSQLNKITEGLYKKTNWQQWNPFSGLMGKILVSQVQEEPKRKMKNPKILNPSQSNIEPEIFERFFKHMDSLLEYISLSAQLDLDKIIVTSPVSDFITYSLRNTYLLLIQHEHRHINQAITLKNNPAFPVI